MISALLFFRLLLVRLGHKFAAGEDAAGLRGGALEQVCVQSIPTDTPAAAITFLEWHVGGVSDR